MGRMTKITTRMKRLENAEALVKLTQTKLSVGGMYMAKVWFKYHTFSIGAETFLSPTVNSLRATDVGTAGPVCSLLILICSSYKIEL